MTKIHHKSLDLHRNKRKIVQEGFSNEQQTTALMTSAWIKINTSEGPQIKPGIGFNSQRAVDNKKNL